MQAWIGRTIFVLVTGCAFWLIGQSQATVHSQSPAGGTSAADELHVLSTMLPTGVQQLSIVDASVRTLAIYHVDPGNGKVQLKSVRNLVWDLRMEHFNGQSPLPSELRQVQP